VYINRSLSSTPGT